MAVSVSHRLIAGLVLVACMPVAALTAASPSRAAEPAWVTDWTVLIADFDRAIAGCAAAALPDAPPGTPPGPVRIHRLAPQNRGYGLVELENDDGDPVLCSADLATGEVNFVQPDSRDGRDEQAPMLLAVPSPVTDSACREARIATGEGWTGWLVKPSC